MCVWYIQLTCWGRNQKTTSHRKIFPWVGTVKLNNHSIWFKPISMCLLKAHNYSILLFNPDFFNLFSDYGPLPTMFPSYGIPVLLIGFSIMLWGPIYAIFTCAPLGISFGLTGGQRSPSWETQQPVNIDYLSISSLVGSHFLSSFSFKSLYYIV